MMTSFNDKRKQQMGVRSLADLKRSGKVSGGLNTKLFINGPKEFDCLIDSEEQSKFWCRIRFT
jgi:hypothetical protein